jgi:hypothetical protein
MPVLAAGGAGNVYVASPHSASQVDLNKKALISTGIALSNIHSTRARSISEISTPLAMDLPTGSAAANCLNPRILVPKLFAGLHVEREHVVVDRHAKEFALINRRRAYRNRPVCSPIRVAQACARSSGFNVDGECSQLAA